MPGEGQTHSGCWRVKPTARHPGSSRGLGGRDRSCPAGSLQLAGRSGRPTPAAHVTSEGLECETSAVPQGPGTGEGGREGAAAPGREDGVAREGEVWLRPGNL